MKTSIQLIIGIAVCLGLAWLLRIEPEIGYGWFMGIIHGLLFVPNCIIHLFDHSWLLKATQYTRMYNIDWWVCSVVNVLYWIWALIGAVLSIIRK